MYEATTQADFREHEQYIHIQQEFKCDHCGHIVLSKSDLKGHLEAYHEDLNSETVFICAHCDEEFSSKIELEVHTSSNHIQEDSSKCDKCEFEGSSIEDLKRHRQSEHFHFKYFCCKCNYETLNKDVLKLHKLEQHGDEFLETRKEKVFPLQNVIYWIPPTPLIAVIVKEELRNQNFTPWKKEQLMETA